MDIVFASELTKGLLTQVECSGLDQRLARVERWLEEDKIPTNLKNRAVTVEKSKQKTIKSAKSSINAMNKFQSYGYQ